MFRLNHLQKTEFAWTVELQTLEKPTLNTPGKYIRGFIIRVSYEALLLGLIIRVRYGRDKP